MGLLFQIEGVKLLGERVWRAPLSPSEVRLLGLSAPSTSDRTVLLLDGQPRYDAESGRLAFDPSAAKLLCAGTSSDAILLGGAEATPPSTPRGQQQNRPAPRPSGDAAFLSALPANLAELGRAVLEAVRSRYAGELRFYQKSGRYIDTPDNFWTIKPQPRDVSFRITVRGTPDSFSGVGGLQVGADQTGYSSFKIERLDQIALFNRLMEQVRRR
ncbi:MAG: hypothetical protein KIT47_11690 [Rhodoferax sp.]|nr:hypothetical protein [Rhodoferax sp.]